MSSKKILIENARIVDPARKLDAQGHPRQLHHPHRKQSGSGQPEVIAVGGEVTEHAQEEWK